MILKFSKTRITSSAVFCGIILFSMASWSQPDTKTEAASSTAACLTGDCPANARHDRYSYTNPGTAEARAAAAINEDQNTPSDNEADKKTEKIK